jgi:hypothetical protein
MESTIIIYAAFSHSLGRKQTLRFSRFRRFERPLSGKADAQDFIARPTTHVHSAGPQVLIRQKMHGPGVGVYRVNAYGSGDR